MDPGTCIVMLESAPDPASYGPTCRIYRGYSVVPTLGALAPTLGRHEARDPMGRDPALLSTYAALKDWLATEHNGGGQQGPPPAP